MRTESWIIFHAEPDQPGWENRRLPMGGLTDILTEHWDFTEDGDIPKVGDRFREFLQIEESVDPKFPNNSTHARDGDWIVTRVERYSADSLDCSKREIVLCYCRFDPIESEPQLIGRSKSIT